MSVLEWLNLPAGFGYLLLVLGLVLTLAPWFYGHDFGVLKIPDFAAPTRRALKAVGPVALAMAILLHVPLLAGTEPGSETGAGTGAPIVAGSGGTETDREQRGYDRVLADWQEEGCLYPARVVGREGGNAELRFDFGEDATRPLREVYRMREPDPTIGASAWARIPQSGAWAPATVRDVRTNRLLVEFDPDVRCATELKKLREWLAIADVAELEPLEN